MLLNRSVVGIIVVVVIFLVVVCSSGILLSAEVVAYELVSIVDVLGFVVEKTILFKSVIGDVINTVVFDSSLVLTGAGVVVYAVVFAIGTSVFVVTCLVDILALVSAGGGVGTIVNLVVSSVVIWLIAVI